MLIHTNNQEEDNTLRHRARKREVTRFLCCQAANSCLTVAIICRVVWKNDIILKGCIGEKEGGGSEESRMSRRRREDRKGGRVVGVMGGVGERLQGRRKQNRKVLDKKREMDLKKWPLLETMLEASAAMEQGMNEA